MKVVAIIPARLSSRRFPRKVLARDTGKYLVEHVYERVVGCPGIDRVLIATDSDEVRAAAQSFGAEAVLTAPTHVSGTDRVAEVARELDHDIVVNVQGDEPTLEHDDLQTLIRLFEPAAGSAGPARTVMTTLAVKRADPEGFQDPNIVKVVLAIDGHALYFSRAPVPSAGAVLQSERPQLSWYQHLGLYAYRREFLMRFSRLEPTELEGRERLEQLRALDHGYRIRVGVVPRAHVGIDTPEDYKEFVASWRLAHGGRMHDQEGPLRNAD